MTGLLFSYRSADAAFLAAGNFSVPTSAMSSMVSPSSHLPDPSMANPCLQPSPISPFHIPTSKCQHKQLQLQQAVGSNKTSKPVILNSLGSSIVSSTPSSTSSSCSSSSYCSSYAEDLSSQLGGQPVPSATRLFPPSNLTPSKRNRPPKSAPQVGRATIVEGSLWPQENASLEVNGGAKVKQTF